MVESLQSLEKRIVPAVRRLRLNDYRSYQNLDLELEEASVIALCGENGAGKTNVLEALSLLTAGRGLRRADYSDCARANGSGGFGVSVELMGPYGPVQLGTGIDLNEGPRRKFRLNRAPASSIRPLAEHVRVVWLTPSMDGLFSGSPGERRRFVDRLVLAVDPEHGGRVNALEKALRNRNRLLEERPGDSAWLDAAEQEAAEVSIAVAAARRETIERLGSLIAAGQDASSPFPWAQIRLEGEIDRLIQEQPALEAEDAYRRLLRDSRRRDAAAGRTLTGPQSSDLEVKHGPKGIAAAQCSTGEQKALLVGLALAHAKLVKMMSGIAPLTLLDEVAAHFDPRRRKALFELLDALGGQVWMSGADPQAFADLPGRSVLVQVTPGHAAQIQQ